MSDAVLLPAVDAPPRSSGSQLAAAREVLGLSVADIAQQLKLSPSQVQALESDDYGRLPGAVFVRGFIRNYARLVKLDAATLLLNVEHELPHTIPVSATMLHSVEIPFPVARGFGWQKYAIAAIAISIPVVIFEFYSGDEPVAVSSRQVDLPAPQVVAELTPPEQSAPSPVLALAPLNEVAPAMPQSKPAQVVVEPAPAVKVAPGKVEQVVRLRFSRASWVEIQDRSGRKIFSQLNAAGTEQVVRGMPPLAIVVGNARGVQLIHNEQPVNLGPYTKIDVARLTLE